MPYKALVAPPVHHKHTKPAIKALRLTRYTYLVEPSINTAEFRFALTTIPSEQLGEAKSLKHDGTTTVSQARLDGLLCVIKRYNTKNRWHGVRRVFRRSRALNCWLMSHTFQASGINTPDRLAVIQAWFGPFKLRSWYISRFVEGEDLQTHILSLSENQIDQLEHGSVYTGIGQLFSAMRSHQLSHGDMKATNVIVDQKQTSLILIDLDAAKAHGSKDNLARALGRDWVRFLKNWRSDPAIYDMFKALNPLQLKKPK